MKRFFALILLLTNILPHLNAQLKQIAEGPAFEEPEDGYARILQMKDGSTMFFHFGEKKGIDVRLYNSEHKEKASTTLETTYQNLFPDPIVAIFEVSGNAVIMVSTAEDGIYVLNRLIIDGKTGKLREDKKIAEFPKFSTKEIRKLYMNGIHNIIEFHVRKDAYSDNYAIAKINNAAEDKNKRIEIQLFDSANKETVDAFYLWPNEKFEYLTYLDMIVLGRDKVFLLAYADNTYKSKSEASGLVMGAIDKSATTGTLKELAFSQNLEEKWAITKFNPVSKKIILLTATQERKSKSGSYTPVLAVVDPVTITVEKTKTLEMSDDVLEKSVETFGKKSAFTGLPQNLFINQDGRITVVSQELTESIFSDQHSSHVNTQLGNIAVVNYSPEMGTLNSYFIPQKQDIPYASVPPFYLSKFEGTATKLGQGVQFKSFQYINGNSKSYIFLNDVEKNDQKIEKGKITGIGWVSDCDGFYFPLQDKEVMPHRNFVFTPTNAKNDHNLGVFPLSEYDAANNLFVTLKLERQGRNKNVKLVWLQL